MLEGTQWKRHLAELGRTGGKMLLATSPTAVDGKTVPCQLMRGPVPDLGGLAGMRPKAICVTGGSQRQP
jgi:hypothetical protein